MSVDGPKHELSWQTPAAIVVVDNDTSVRELISRWLTADGHACTQAADAQTAWERLQAHEVQLVTLDIRMAEGSGIELLHQIVKAYPDTSVIMVSALKDAEMAIEALTYGACAYLVKPVKRDQLIFHARRALQRRQLVIDNRQYLRRLEQRVREQTLAIRRAHEETIHRLVSASLVRGEETCSHLRRIGLLSGLLAEAAGWSPAETESIRLAAPMHDVGRIGISDAILHKPGQLLPEESEAMKQHTVIGARMLAGSNIPMLQMAHQIALNHHERWDGKGFPAGLAGHAIPEAARIVAIVDAYDALTHHRVHRPALREEEAIAIVQRRVGSHFDPLLAALFFSRLPDISRVAEDNPDERAVENRAPCDVAHLSGSGEACHEWETRT